MLSKEEIEKAKDVLNNFKLLFLKNIKENTDTYICNHYTKVFRDNIEILLQYIDQLEQENKALKKGQASLMASRKKWKDRYYKLKRKSIKQNKIIDEMAEYLAIIRDCPNEDKGANLDCENRCSNDDSLYAECWKLYFEKKVEEK